VRQEPLEGLQPGRAAAGGQGPSRGAQRRPLRPTSLAQFRTHTATYRICDPAWTLVCNATVMIFFNQIKKLLQS